MWNNLEDLLNAVIWASSGHIEHKYIQLELLQLSVSVIQSRVSHILGHEIHWRFKCNLYSIIATWLPIMDEEWMAMVLSLYIVRWCDLCWSSGSCFAWDRRFLRLPIFYTATNYTDNLVLGYLKQFDEQFSVFSLLGVTEYTEYISNGELLHNKGNLFNELLWGELYCL